MIFLGWPPPHIFILSAYGDETMIDPLTPSIANNITIEVELNTVSFSIIDYSHKYNHMKQIKLSA
jgi:hypothetical protein